MKIAVINSSREVYNLATHRITNYHLSLGDEVSQANGLALMTPEIWNAEKFYFSK
jgi:hypothetical protein